MARLFSVKKTRVERTCSKCGKPIEIGSSLVYYSYMISKRGRTRYFHAGCRPAYWEYATQNPKRQAHMRAGDALSGVEGADTAEDAANLIRDAIGEVENIIADLDNYLDANMGTGLSQGEMYQNFEATKDALQDWRDNAETIADTLNDLENAECPDCAGTGSTDCPDCDDGVATCSACTDGVTAGGGLCTDCDGHGLTTCEQCDGNGTIDCVRCDGSGKATDDEWRETAANLEDLPDLEF